MKYILIPIAVISITMAIIAIYILNIRECVQSHKEMRHQEAWTQMVITGKVIVPIFHPESDYEVDVCDEYK